MGAWASASLPWVRRDVVQTSLPFWLCAGALVTEVEVPLVRRQFSRWR